MYVGLCFQLHSFGFWGSGVVVSRRSRTPFQLIGLVVTGGRCANDLYCRRTRKALAALAVIGAHKGVEAAGQRPS